MSKQVKIAVIIGSFLLVGIVVIAVVMSSKKKIGSGDHKELESGLFNTTYYKGGTIGGIIEGYLGTISLGKGGMG